MESPATEKRSDQAASMQPCDEASSESSTPGVIPADDAPASSAKMFTSAEEVFTDSGSSDSTLGGKRGADDTEQEETGRKRRRQREEALTSKHATRTSSKPYAPLGGQEKATKVSSASAISTNKLSSESQKSCSKGSLSVGSPTDSPVRVRGHGMGVSLSEDSDENEPRPKVPPLKIVINSTASDGSSGASNFGASGGDVDAVGCASSTSRLPYVVASQEAGSAGECSEVMGECDTSAAVSDPQSTAVDEHSGHDHPGYGPNPRVTRSYRNADDSVVSESTSVGDDYFSDQQGASGHQQTSDVESVAPTQNEDVVQLSSFTSSELTIPPSPGSNAVSSNVDLANCSIPVVEHPRKRRFRQARAANHRQSDQQSAGMLQSSDSQCSAVGADPLQASFTNNYKMYSEIRRQVERRCRELFPISPKPPRGYRDYLLNRRSYVLYGNRHSRLSMPSAAVPSSLDSAMKQLYTEQEMERYKLRLQHIIDKEKLVLAVEQEILRVHGRAARALANQSLPFSACSMLKHEEVYTLVTPEQEEKERNIRHRYNGRQFCSWLQDVEDKWEKIREQMILRQHSEAEALYAVQMMDWTCRLRETGNVSDQRPVFDQQHVPMVKVIDDFDIPST